MKRRELTDREKKSLIAAYHSEATVDEIAVEAQYVRDGIEAFESAIAVLDGEVSGCRECGAVDPCVHDAGGGQ